MINFRQIFNDVMWLVIIIVTAITIFTTTFNHMIASYVTEGESFAWACFATGMITAFIINMLRHWRGIAKAFMEMLCNTISCLDQRYRK